MAEVACISYCSELLCLSYCAIRCLGGYANRAKVRLSRPLAADYRTVSLSHHTRSSLLVTQVRAFAIEVRYPCTFDDAEAKGVLSTIGAMATSTMNAHLSGLGRMLRNLILPAVLTFTLSHATQAQAHIGEQRRQATRAELEQMAKAAEGAAQAAPDAKTKERMMDDASAIRMRLKNGDFVPGDRILIEILGDSASSDTFTVRGDRMLQLPNLPDISLAGVLDSELKDHLTKEVGKYVKQPELNATSLLRLAMMGQIGRGGFITIPMDQAITDVLMATGGPGSSADFNKTVVRRSGKVVVSAEEFQEAVRANRTVGDMSLRDGDEIFVPDKKQGQNVLQYLQLVSALIGFYFILRWGRRPTGTAGPNP